MRIDLRILADELRDNHPDLIRHGGSGCEIGSVRLWSNAVVRPDIHCLYGTAASELPALLPEKSSLIIAGMPPDGRDAGSSYIAVPGCQDPSALVSEVQGIIIQLQSWHCDIMRLAVEGEDVQKLLDRSVPVFNNPLALNLVSHGLIFGAGLAVSPATENIWNQIKTAYVDECQRPESEPILSPRQVAELHSSRKPAAFCFGPDNTRCVACQILDGNRRVASLSVSELSSRFKGSEASYIQVLSECVSLMLSRRYSFADDRQGEALLHLLRGDQIGEEPVGEAVAPLGWQMHHRYQVAVIQPKDAGLEGQFVAEQFFYRMLLSSLYPHSKTLFIDNHIVLFGNLSLHSESQLERDGERMRHFLEETSTCLGCSLPFTDLMDAAAFYRQAESMASMASESNTAVYDYSDHVVDHLIRDFVRAHDYQYYLHPDVRRLADYDREHGSELLFTLYIYLLHDRSYQACADKYYLHRNSLIYRLRKIASLIENDLNDEVTRLSILLSARMYWHVHPELDRSHWK